MRYDGLIIPRSYNDYFSKSSPQELTAALKNIGIIPDAASSQNQLGDKAYINSKIQTETANFRGNWATWEEVPTDGAEYPTDYAGNNNPTTNDYMVVQNGAGYGAAYTGTWRFKYAGDWGTTGKAGWSPEYQVNETPLTPAQLAAINSGITDQKVALIDAKQNGRVASSFEDAGIDIAGLASPNDMINILSAKSELWVQINNTVASQLYQQGVIPVSKGGVLHVINTAAGGRNIMTYYDDDGKSYHYETSNSNSSIGVWRLEVKHPVGTDLTTLFPAWETYTIANEFLRAIPTGSEVWFSINSAEAATLYANGTIRVNAGGTIHLVRYGNYGGIVEHIVYNNTYRHYAGSVTESTNNWYKYAAELI